MDNFPKPNSVVIATAKKVLEHGAYFHLDEYGIEAYMPIGEVSASRVVNIEDVVKEGKKYVCKVIRVDPYRGHVDISLKKVTEQERKSKMIEWKRNQRAIKLIELVAERLKMNKDQLLNILSSYIGDEFIDYLSIFERPIKEGYEILDKLDLDKNIKAVLIEVAKEHIKIPIPELKAEIALFTSAKDGIKLIKEILENAHKSLVDIKGLREVEITYIGATRFLVRVQANNFKIAELALERFENSIKNNSKKLNIFFSFKRL